MKKYLLYTTAFLGLASISYATDEQEEKGNFSSPTQRIYEVAAEHQTYLESLNAKYAPEILPLNVFKAIAQSCPAPA